MEEKDEQLRTELVESMLAYLEGDSTFRAILAIGITAYNKYKPQMPWLAEIVAQLNDMGNQVAGGKKYSPVYIRETFTTMLEKLVTK